jgi:hypothetical protein
MKYLLMVWMVLALSPLTLRAQKAFEGMITYKIQLMGENADQLAAFMPEAYQYKIRGNLIRFHMEGGITAALLGDILIDTKKGDAFMIKEAEKTAYLIKDTGETPPGPVVEPEEEVITILGYPCQKYKVTTPAETGSTVQYVWATRDIQIVKPQKSNGTAPAGAGQILIEGLDGFPLKVMTTVPEGGLILVMTASEVELLKIDKSDMEIPKDFTVKDFDPSMFGGY